MVMARKVALFVIILISSLIINLNHKQFVMGETTSDVEKLLRDKFSPAVYNKQIRGQADLSTAMNITLTFELKSIIKLDDLREILEALGLLTIEWTDERLSWNPDAYNGTTQVYVGAADVWRPEIVVANPSSTIRFLGDDITRMVTRHFYSGLAEWKAGDVFHSSCSVDLTSFPWDKQNCTITFVTWAYNGHEVQLVAKQDSIEMRQFESNSQWTLMSTRSYTFGDQIKSFVGVEIVMKRRSTFFIVNILLPIITLSVLNLVVFTVPVESGERISFSLTVLLSIGVFITLISENLPPSAETMASICYLLLLVLVQSTIICLLNIISVNIYFNADDVLRSEKFWNKCFVFCNKIRCCSQSKHLVDKTKRAKVKFESYTEGSTKSFEYDNYEQESVSWKDISKMLDKVFLVLMTLLLIFVYSMFVYYVSK